VPPRFVINTELLLKCCTRIIGATTVLIYGLLVLTSAPAEAQAASKPRVVVITMGDTIASRLDGASMTPGAALIAAVPELAGVRRTSCRGVHSPRFVAAHA